jgi:hypothetical protein
VLLFCDVTLCLGLAIPRSRDPGHFFSSIQMPVLIQKYQFFGANIKK